MAKKKSVLDNLKSKLEKNVKGLHVDVLSKSSIAKINEWVPTPSYDLNRILSGDLFKGLPEKTFTVLVGPEASFKSSFMALSMANAQKMGFIPIIIDTEGAWTDDFVIRWGLDPDNMLYSYCPFVNDIISILGNLIEEGGDNKYIIAIDSVGNLEQQKVLTDIDNKGEAKEDQGGLQKKIKRMLKLVLALCKKQSSIAIAGGHFYGSPSMFGAAEEIGGGYHMRLAPHIIVSLKKEKMFENDDKKKIIGTRIKAVTLKNRFYPAFQTCEVDIDYRKGVNKTAGLLDIAVDAGIIEKKGSWYVNCKTKEKFQGKNQALELLQNDEILNDINEHIKLTGYSSVDENIKEVMGEVEEFEEEFEEENEEEGEEENE